VAGSWERLNPVKVATIGFGTRTMPHAASQSFSQSVSSLVILFVFTLSNLNCNILPQVYVLRP